jgi:ribulose-5-phosphate 4-epimerase/fuculose-1-phosphate aldolase
MQGAQPFTLEALRQEICRVGRSLFERGYVHATAGNISARVPSPAGGGFLITPTEACLGFLEPGQLAWLDAAGQQHSGPPASKTWLLHHRIYEADALAHCIIHTHSTHLVSLTLQDPTGQGDLLPPITPYFVMKVGHVPRIAYHRPGDPRAADRVVQEIARARAAGRPLRAVMLDRLGPNVWHSSPAQAMAVLEELEETARLWCMSSPRPPSLTTAQIDELRQHFNAPW